MRPVIRELLLGSQAPISPAQLFSGGRQGFWFDFVTPGVWFQDSAGTTTVSAADQPSGLILDRSKNGVGINGDKRINLLNYSQDFENVYWNTVSGGNPSVTVLANQTTAPDGTLTADLMTETTSTSTHRVVANGGSFVVSGTPVVTLSCSYKANTGNALALLFLTDSTGSRQAFAWFNLSTGEVSGTNTEGNAVILSTSISPAGNGFYRCTLTGTVTSTVSGTFAFCGMANANLSKTYSGNTDRSVFIWGAQLELGTVATPYQRIDASWPATIPGNHALQSTAAARPTSKLSPSRIFLDKTDDRMLITVPTGGFVGTLVLATTEGTAAYGANIPAGTWALGANTTTGTIYFPGTTIVGAICRNGAMSDAEIARCIAYLRSIWGGAANYSGITTFANYWRNAAWLTGFVANAFNGSSATDFTNAFTGCALDQTSVDNILVSINSNGTSGGALNLTGGTNSAPSATGAAAVTALQSRSWTVTTN